MGCTLDPSIDPSLLPAVEQPGKLRILCGCACVGMCIFIVRLLLVQPHKVSRVTTALGARSKLRLRMQSGS